MFPRIWSQLLVTTLTVGFCLQATAEEIDLHFEGMDETGFKQWVVTEFPALDIDPSLPIVGPSKDNAGVGLLRRLSAQGKAAGFDGIAYDNRDRGHSDLPVDLFPRLARWSYATELRNAGLDYGLAGSIFLPGITF